MLVWKSALRISEESRISYVIDALMQVMKQLCGQVHNVLYKVKAAGNYKEIFL